MKKTFTSILLTTILMGASIPASAADLSAVFSIDGSDPVFLEDACFVTDGVPYLRVNGIEQLFEYPTYIDGDSLVSDIQKNQFSVSLEDGSILALDSYQESLSDTAISEILLLFNQALSFQYVPDYQDAVWHMKGPWIPLVYEGSDRITPNATILGSYQAITYYIEDFDQDGSMELLVARPASDESNLFVFDMYEVDHDTVSRSASYSTDFTIVPSEHGQTRLYLFSEKDHKVMIGYDFYSQNLNFSDGVFMESQHFFYNGTDFETKNSWFRSASDDFLEEDFNAGLASFGLKSVDKQALIQGVKTVQDYLPAYRKSRTILTIDQYFTLSTEEFWKLCEQSEETIRIGARTLERASYLPEACKK